MASLWEQTWEHPGFPALEGDLSTDVLIIGGGMAGVLCAYFLHRAGVHAQIGPDLHQQQHAEHGHSPAREKELAQFVPHGPEMDA